MRSVRFSALLLALLLLLSGCSQGAAQEGHTNISTTLFAMDTQMSLSLYDADQTALDNASALIQELDGLLSVTDTGSEIYAANQGASVALSPCTAALLTAALDVCQSVDGALDVTIYPVTRAWGFTTQNYRVPDDDELARLLARVDYTQVRLEGSVLTLPDGVELDLGAVAKGYTGDLLMAQLQEDGVSSALISLGGNIQVLGSKPDGTPWRVGIRVPGGEAEDIAAVVSVTDKAVVTSGGYERCFDQDGVRYWHILDPATGQPARTGLSSVTIVSASGVLADGLSTALFVMGKDRAADYWRTRDDFDFILLAEDGTVTISEGIEDCFSLSGEWTGHTLEVIRR